MEVFLIKLTKYPFADNRKHISAQLKIDMRSKAVYVQHTFQER